MLPAPMPGQLSTSTIDYDLDRVRPEDHERCLPHSRKQELGYARVMAESTSQA